MTHRPETPDSGNKAPELRACLKAVRCEPCTALLVGEEAAAAARGLEWIQASTVFTELPGNDALSRAGRHAVAVVAGVLEGVDRRRGMQLLQALRDLHAGRVLAVVAAEAPWERTDFFGLGFTELGPCVHRGVPRRVYGYDIDTYKHTPDWLNPDNWANPELFDRFRW